MKRSTLFTAFILLAALTACDDTPGVVDITQKQPSFSHFEVSPAYVEFLPEDGAKDTSVVFDVSVLLDHTEPLEARPVISFSSKGSDEVLATDTLGSFDADLYQDLIRYSGKVVLPLTTTTSGDYMIYIRADLPDNKISNTAHANITVKGFATGRPEIVSVNHPDTVQIPGIGTRPIIFEAEVNHPNGQHNIDRVNLELIDQNDEPIGKFPMNDEGTDGDRVRGDGIYTLGLEIGSTNNPDVYTVKIHAEDRFESVSDTVVTQMAIIR